MLKVPVGVREIARRLGRAPSTISRELRRNASTSTYRLEHKASIAQSHAERRARRPKTAKLVSNDRLRQYVQDKLSGVVRGADGQVVAGPAPASWKGRNKPHRGDRAWVTAWSPEQIANRITLDFPDNESIRISHEAIYQALYVESRGALKRELVSCLRRGRPLQVPIAKRRRGEGGARRAAWPRAALLSQRQSCTLGWPGGDDSATKRRRPLGWWCPMCTFCKPECCSTSVSGFGGRSRTVAGPSSGV